MEAFQKEKIFYQDANVTVTQSRYIADFTTYTMRNISSVSIGIIERSRFFPSFLFVIGLLFLFSESTITIGIILVIAGIVWFFSIKNLFVIKISTNAGEVNSFASEDPVYIKKIIDSLNAAIIYRG